MPPLTLSVSQRRVLAALALALLAGVLVVRQHGGPAAAPPLRVAPVRPQAAPRPAARPIVVDVVGAVREPGLYHLADGARVADAVAQAGGLSRRADRSAVNLAARSPTGSRSSCTARGSPGGAAAAGSRCGRVRRAGLAQRGDRRAARHAARHRAGDGREDRRLPPGARAVHVGRGSRCDPRHRPCTARGAAGAGRPREAGASRRAGAGGCGRGPRWGSPSCALRRPVRALPAAAARARGGVPARTDVRTATRGRPRCGLAVRLGVGRPAPGRARPQRAAAGRRDGRTRCASSSPAKRASGGSASASPPASSASIGGLCTSACSSSSRPAARRPRARS